MGDIQKLLKQSKERIWYVFVQADRSNKNSLAKGEHYDFNFNSIELKMINLILLNSF